MECFITYIFVIFAMTLIYLRTNPGSDTPVYVYCNPYRRQIFVKIVLK